MVSKANVLSNPKRAAKHALAALAYVRSHSPFPVGDGEPAAPSVINKDGVKKGVVKLGWSWEARFVSIFHSEEDLAVKLTEMLTKEGCLAQTCIVQEWVDFDFEMRLYFLPPEDWTPMQKLQPTRIGAMRGQEQWRMASDETFTNYQKRLCLANIGKRMKRRLSLPKSKRSTSPNSSLVGCS